MWSRFINGLTLVINNIQDRFTWVGTGIDIIKLSYKKYAQPVVNLFSPLWQWLWNIYKRIFTKYAIVNDVVDKEKAAYVLPLMVFGSWLLFFIVIPVTVDFGADGIAVMTKHTNVELFLTGAQPLDESISLFRAKGCPEMPCTDNNSIYYHIQPNQFEFVRRLILEQSWYLPDQIEAAIPDQLSKCVVDVQWFRVRWIKHLPFIDEWFPTIVKVHSCYPVSAK